MAIRSQVDPDYAGDHFVAFVESEDVYRPYGPGGHGDMCSGEVYSVSLHHRPIRTDQPMGFAWCKHWHRSIDAAKRCAKQMLREARRNKWCPCDSIDGPHPDCPHHG